MKKNVAIYYINLDRSEERHSHMQNVLKDFAYDVHRISAVDGKKLSYEEVPEYMYEYREKYYDHLTLTEIACTLSHKKAMEEFLQSDYDYAMILEDDILPTPELHTFLAHMEDLKGWDVIKLENRKYRKKDLNYLVKEIEGISVYVPKTVTLGALAIMYTKDGAKKVLNMNEKIYYEFDTQFNMSKKYDVKYLSVSPDLVTLSQFKSDIGYDNREQHHDKTLLHKYRRRNIRLFQSIEKVLYQKQLYAYFKNL